MNQIYVSTIYSGSLKSASELFKFCADGDFEKVKSLTNANANIYKPVGGGYNFVPLTVAFNVKNLKLVNFLLDIYERDLEALKGTNFKRALVAFPDDQTEELCKTVEAEPSDDVVPVLFKNSNRASPKCFYLRQKLANKYDQSLRLARKLEVENGCCDLNWRFIHSDPEDSFLHLAIYFGMKTVVGRLLNHPTVESKLLNSNSHSPLHYAIHSGNHLIINLLLSKSDYSRFHDDPSYLYQAAVSGKPNALDFVMDKMLESGKSLHDILRTKFQFEDGEQTTRFDYLFHVIANSGSCQGILESEKYLYDEQDFLLQNSNGDTFLHRLVLNSHLKLNVKIKEISRAAGKFPKLLLVENIDKHLPLHLAAFADVRGHKLFHHLLNLTVKESGNPSIFFANIDSAVSTVEKAIEVNRGFCSRDDILRIVCEFYASRNVKIAVNDVNGNGDNMPMIALNNSNAEHLDFIFSNFIDEINFDARNKTGETFVHKFALCQQMMRCEALFEKIPILSAIVNKQMNSVNDNGLSPMDNLLVICEYDGGVNDTSINFIIKFISVENLRKNFHKFVKSFLLTQKLMEKFPKILDDMKGDKYYRIMSESTIEPQTFDFILHQLSSKLADVRNSYGKNVLHLVCESNDPAIIDSTIKLLLDDDLKEFANEIDVSNQRAFDLLNDIHKSAFGKCFV